MRARSYASDHSRSPRMTRCRSAVFRRKRNCVPSSSFLNASATPSRHDLRSRTQKHIPLLCRHVVNSGRRRMDAGTTGENTYAARLLNSVTTLGLRKPSVGHNRDHHFAEGSGQLCSLGPQALKSTGAGRGSSPPDHTKESGVAPFQMHRGRTLRLGDSEHGSGQWGRKRNQRTNQKGCQRRGPLAYARPALDHPLLPLISSARRDVLSGPLLVNLSLGVENTFSHDIMHTAP